jgi:hypothetical protein
MKHIVETINESKIKKTDYYNETLVAFHNLLVTAPSGNYTLNSSEVKYAVDDLLTALQEDNTLMNDGSLDGEIDTNDIKKLGATFGKKVAEALYASCNEDFDMRNGD